MGTFVFTGRQEQAGGRGVFPESHGKMANLNPQDQGSVGDGQERRGTRGEIQSQPTSREKKHVDQKEESEAGNQDKQHISPPPALPVCRTNHTQQFFSS